MSSKHNRSLTAACMPNLRLHPPAAVQTFLDKAGDGTRGVINCTATPSCTFKFGGAQELNASCSAADCVLPGGHLAAPHGIAADRACCCLCVNCPLRSMSRSGVDKALTYGVFVNDVCIVCRLPLCSWPITAATAAAATAAAAAAT